MCVHPPLYPVGREYTLRMSAIEIYNEKVRDLLKDGTERQNLPLLDDPERGTVAEGLSEEWPRSEQHLCQLLRQIEARRTVSSLHAMPEMRSWLSHHSTQTRHLYLHVPAKTCKAASCQYSLMCHGYISAVLPVNRVPTASIKG